MKYVSEMGFLALASAILFSSCTRPAGNSSQVTLNFSSARQMNQSASSDEQPQHIAVNISASDIAPFFYAWDNNGDMSGSTSIPSITATITQGSARLVQVLYVSQDASNNLFFYYDDVTMDFNSSSVNVPLAPSLVTSSSVQGKIAGRYVNANGAGPTGILNSYFIPGANKPAMIVDKNEIFGGWFSAFSLPGQNFNYKFEDGTALLMNFQASATNVSGPATALFKIPPSYKMNGTDFDASAAQLILAGFFGPGASGKKICVNSSTDANISSLYMDATTNYPVSWNGSGSGCGTNQSCLISGGDGVATDCTAALVDDVSVMKLDETLLANSDDALLFHGPFQLQKINGNAQGLTGTQSGNSLTLNWKFMPGAAADLDGVELFYKWDASSNNSGDAPYKTNNDGYDCAHLVSSYGFTSGGQIASSSQTANINVGSGASNQSLVAIACAFSRSHAGVYFSTAAMWNSNSIFNANPALMTWTDPGGGSYNTMGTNSCRHFKINFISPSGGAFSIQNPSTMNFSANVPGGGFSTDQSCSSPNSQLTLSVNAGDTSEDIYFRSSSVARYYSVQVALPGFNNLSVDLASPSASAATSLVVSSPQAMANGSCYPVEVKLEDNSANPAIGGEMFQLAFSGGLSGNYYADSACSTTNLMNTSQTIPTGDHAMTLYYKASVTGQTYNGTITATSVSPALSITPQSSISADLASISSYRFNTSLTANTYEPADCISIQPYAVNSVGAMVTPTSDQTLTVTPPNGAVLMDACSGGNQVSSFVVSASGQQSSLFLIPTGPNVSMMAQDTNSHYGLLSGLTMKPPTSFTNSFYVANMGTGLCYPVNISAKDSQGRDYKFLSSGSSTAVTIQSSEAQFYSDSACTSTNQISTIYFPQNSQSANNAWAIYQNPDTPSISLMVNGTTAPLNSSFSLNQTMLIPGSANGCTMTSGADTYLTLLVYNSGGPPPTQYIPLMTITGVSVIGSSSPKFCLSSSSPYSGSQCSATLTGSLQIQPGSINTSTFNIKTQDAVSEPALHYYNGGAYGVQVSSSNTVTCN